MIIFRVCSDIKTREVKWVLNGKVESAVHYAGISRRILPKQSKEVSN